MKKYDIEEAINNNKKPNVETIEEYKKRAYAGDTKAYYRLGELCHDIYKTSDVTKTGFEWFEKGAKLGDAECIARLAQCYRTGTGVEENIKTAISLFNQAIRRGSLLVYGYLGICYEFGHGVKKDTIKAFELYLEGAKLGDGVCACNVAACYEYAIGVSKDIELAKKYYLIACDKSIARAFHNYGSLFIDNDIDTYITYLTYAGQLSYSKSYEALAFTYYFGKKVESNYEMAFKYFKLAADSGNLNCINIVAILYNDGQGVEKDIQKCFEYYSISAKNGNVDGLFGLAICYEEGRHVEVDYVKAIEYYKQAVEKGSNNSKTNLGRLYENGFGCKLDNVKATSLYKEASENDPEIASRNYARQLKDGAGVEGNIDLSIELLTKIIEETNNTDAMNDLGLIYSLKEGYIDATKAIKYFSMAYENDCVYGIHNIGDMYHRGLGVEIDYVKAFECYEKANNMKENVWTNYELSLLYENGYGVKKDLNKSKELCYKAAKDGLKDAVLKVINYENEINKFTDSSDIETLEQERNDKNRESIYKLGVIYSEGIIVEKDLKKAFEYFSESAQYGHLKGIEKTATCLYEGIGTNVCQLLALDWFEIGAETNNPYLQMLYGQKLFERGNEDKVMTKGVEWIKKAADNNFEQAISFLVKIGDENNGKFGFDINTKIEMLEKASKNSNALNFKLADVYLEIACEKNTKEASEKAYKFISKSLCKDKENGDLFYLLGECYLKGIGVYKDLISGLFNINKALKLNSTMAQKFHDVYFENNKYTIDSKIRFDKEVKENNKFSYDASCDDIRNAVLANPLIKPILNTDVDSKDFEKIGLNSEYYFNEKDYKTSKSLAVKASPKGSYVASYILGKLYFYGLGVKVDKEKALEYFITSMQQKQNTTAKFELSKCIFEGLLICENNYLSNQLVKECALEGNVDAIYELGVIYYSGTEVVVDIDEANKWFTLAKELGNVNAMFGCALIAISKEDHKLGLTLLIEAANSGCISAMLELRVVYDEGLLNERVNKNISVDWLKKACLNGHGPSLLEAKKLKIKL